MCHERITVLGSSGTDCFHYWDYDRGRKFEAHRGTLIPDTWRFLTNLHGVILLLDVHVVQKKETRDFVLDKDSNRAKNELLI
jgi:hypothetical protein